LVAPGEAQAWGQADVLLCVQSPSPASLGRLRRGALVVGMLSPYGNHDLAEALKGCGLSAMALELLPRISRAQSADVLSSQANIAGYKAVLLGAAALDRYFPMLMTAAGTVQPARVVVLGAGVAGLQAVATARRLGGGCLRERHSPSCERASGVAGRSFHRPPGDGREAS
jgi:NAD(P) transhydrogenase subunit alpha